jgi:hypothetical protein
MLRHRSGDDRQRVAERLIDNPLTTTWSEWAELLTVSKKRMGIANIPFVSDTLSPVHAARLPPRMKPVAMGSAAQIPVSTDSMSCDRFDVSPPQAIKRERMTINAAAI